MSEGVTTRVYTARPTNVASVLGVSESTVRRMCELGELPAIRLKGVWCIGDDWLAVLQSQTEKSVVERVRTEKLRRVAAANTRARVKAATS